MIRVKQINELNPNLDPIEQVLVNRGVEDIRNFLKHDWDMVQDPYALDYAEKAADTILEYIGAEKTVAVIVDSDADGYTSSAVLLNYIYTLQSMLSEDSPKAKIIPLFHSGKMHGLDDTEIMKKLRDELKPDLLIIPDASGSAEQFQALLDLDIKIVVIDHHDTTERGNGETVIIVNNQHSDNYSNKSLSGVGVVWQVCRIMDEKTGNEYANNWLDLVAVGLVADVMPLTSNETRFLIYEGLQDCNIHSRFLKQCLKDMSFSLGTDGLNPIKVAFYIAPLLNATIRIGTFEEKKMLFEALLDNKAYSMVPSGKRGANGAEVYLVEEALRQATNAKSRQKRRQDKLAEAISNVVTEEKLLDNKILLVVIDDFDENERALSGLIANRLQELYRRPAIILFDEGNGAPSGSVRAPSNIEAFQGFREQCLETGLTVYSAGHSQAFGIKIEQDNIQPLIDRFNEKYENVDSAPVFECDFIIPAHSEKLADVIIELERYKGIWGTGLQEPLIAITEVPVSPGHFNLLSADKNPTLKFGLSNGVSAIKFRASKEEFDSLIIKPTQGQKDSFYTITIIGTASVNEFRGELNPQILIKDYEVTGVGYGF